MAKKASTTPSDYVQSVDPRGYINNREITNLDGNYLVAGSRDCFIVNQELVSSRKGYTLLGDAKTKNKGHKSSFDWETNYNRTRSLRMNDDGELEVYFEGHNYLIKQYAAYTRANFAAWWEGTTEKQDLLLFVVQTAGIQMWSGGVAKISAFTATTLTISGYQAATTISFVNGGTGVDDTILDSGNGFLTAGFEVGQEITVTGSTSNNDTYTIKAVTAGVITLSSNDALTTEAAGDSVVIQIAGATWAEQGFLTAGTRKIIFGGTEYEYTGGETTATLTGLTGLSGLVTGDVIVQAVRESTPATLTGLTLDLIGITNNYVFYGDLTSRTICVSKSTDYTDFAYTSPLRKPGEGFILNNMDSTPTAFVPGAVEDEFYICGRKDDWFKIQFVLDSTNGAEEIRVKKLPTSTGQAAQSQGCVFRIKNGVAFLNFEPTIDTLTRLLSVNTPTSKPISDDIRNDIIAYDLTDAHGIFYQNQLFIALPQEGKVIIYDFIDGHWQPPHNLPVGRLALIDINDDGTQILCGHSSVSNETYRLYDGYTDNGAPMRCEMHFGYENNGARFTEKKFDEAASELYMSENTNVNNRIVYDYKGSTDIRDFEIRGDNNAIRFTPKAGGGLGSAPLGTNPFGSLFTPIDDLSKYRPINTTSVKNYFERQRIFWAEGKDIRFSVLAFGENVEYSDDIPSYLKS